MKSSYLAICLFVLCMATALFSDYAQRSFYDNTYQATRVTLGGW